MKCIINGNIILKNCIVNQNLLIEGDRIVGLTSDIPEHADIIDAMGLYVAPGFIDVHTHGRAGSDALYDTFKDLNTISCAAMTTGVTGFLPTTMTNPIDITYRAVKNIAVHAHEVEGAKIIGIHLEGPFLNPIFKGAQPEEFMIAPTVENYLQLVGEYTDIIKKITIAPEREGALDFIRYCAKHQIVTSAGHTNASYEEMMKGIEAGITSSTHTYNAMSPLRHRDVGVPGAAMLSDIYSELILDGIHVSYPAAKILLTMKGKDKIVLITDSMEAANLPDGKYALGGQDVYVKNKQARLIDGTLAGSVLSMNDAVAHARDHLGLTLYEAVNLASLNPANSLHIKDRGLIEAGRLADLVFFDEDITIKRVIIDGNIKWEVE